MRPGPIRAVKPRHNPFRVERIDALAFRPQGASWTELLVRLDEQRYRAAIVGADGSGKTTFLADLARRLPLVGRRPVLRVLKPESTRAEVRAAIDAAAAAGPKDVLLVDGADHLRRLDWWRLRRAGRRAGGLVIASHRAGLLPTLIETRTSAELVAELVRELAPELADRLAPELPTLLAQHHGNVRDALRALYDRAAEIE